MHWHPLRFVPIYQERIWGGHSLASLYNRTLPGNTTIGESWEIVDRPEAQSRVAEGPLAGRTLAELMAEDPRGLLGDALASRGRFPLLVKILDAREVLSVQVHPPADQAARLGGEPKTEFWYFTAARPDAEIFAGLRPGIDRSAFEGLIANGRVAEGLHRLPVRAGDAMYLPSGRVHALGAGLVLLEIQENSDTTYRVFDWNRLGPDGQPRPLHLGPSLASIDFGDAAPLPVNASWRPSPIGEIRSLARVPAFRIEAHRCPSGVSARTTVARCTILGCIQGQLQLSAGLTSIRLGPGDFCLMPAALREYRLQTLTAAEWLVAEPGLHETRDSG